MVEKLEAIKIYEIAECGNTGSGYDDIHSLLPDFAIFSNVAVFNARTI